MIDAPRLQEVQRLPDVLGRAFLTGVHHAGQAHLPRLSEGSDEFARRVAHLGGVEADGQQVLGEGPGVLQRPQRRVLAEVAQEAQDQARRDSQLCRSVREGAADPHAARLERDTTPGVRLRVEEDLGVTHALTGCPGQIGVREVVEVLLRPEHRAVRVVDVEERLQVFEAVGATECVHVGVGQVDLVAGGQFERQFRLEGPFDVHVQLGLGQSPHECGRLGHGRIFVDLAHGPMVPHRGAGTPGEVDRPLRFAH